MDYQKFGETYYIRLDRGDEIVGSIMDVCRKEGILSAYYTGIGGCSDAEIQIFIPEKNGFDTERIEGTLELVNLTGNVIADDNDELYHHTHAHYSFRGNTAESHAHMERSGHIKSSTVLYTAEIELRPVIGGVIRRTYDPETGTGFWRLHE